MDDQPPPEPPSSQPAPKSPTWPWDKIGLTAILAVFGLVAVVTVVSVLTGHDNNTTAASAVPSTSPAALTTTTTPTPTPTTTSSQPPSPEQQFNARAAQEGWDTAGSYRSYGGPAGYVKTICAKLSQPDNPTSPITTAFLMRTEWNGNKPLFEAGVPLFCPQFADTLEAVRDGTADLYHFWDDGHYSVPDEIKPGTYRTRDSVRDCYWERTTAGGDIIENKFITVAKQATVTVKASDGLFTTRGCGDWVRAG